MRITITRTIDVPDDLGSVNALETLVREEGFALMRELTSTLWQRLQEESLRCSHCGSQDVERRGHKGYELLMAFGSVELFRQRVKCRACGAHSQPMDEWLEELGDHRATWLVIGRLRLLGDGAKWIDTVGDEHFQRAKRILDLWHLERQLSRGFKAAIGDKAELARQRAEVGQLIRSGQADRVLVRLRELAGKRGSAGEGVEVPKELSATITYVERNRHAIVNYEAEKAAGEHVGSGAVEKAGDLLVNRRLKGRRGMRWWRKNADGVLALRLLHLNGDWDAHWQRRRLPKVKAA